MDNKNTFSKLCRKFLLFILCFSCITTTISCSPKKPPQVDDNWDEEDNRLSIEIKKEISNFLDDYKNENKNILNFNEFQKPDELKKELLSKKELLIDENSSINITDMLYDKLLNAINFKESFIEKINKKLIKKPRLENIDGNIVNIDSQSSLLFLVWNNNKIIDEITKKLKQDKEKNNFFMSTVVEEKKVVYVTKLSFKFNVKISNFNKNFDYSIDSPFYLTNIEKDKTDQKISIEPLSGDYTNDPPGYLIPGKPIEKLDLFVLLQFYYKENALFLEAINDSAELSINQKILSKGVEEMEATITIDATKSTRYKGKAEIKVKIKPRLNIMDINTDYDLQKNELTLETLTIRALLSSINKSDAFSVAFKKMLNDSKDIVEINFIGNKKRKQNSVDVYIQKIKIKISDEVKTQYYGEKEFEIAIKLPPVNKKIDFYLTNIIADKRNNYYMWNDSTLYFGQHNRDHKQLLKLQGQSIVNVLIDNQNNYYVATSDGQIYYGLVGSTPKKKYDLKKIVMITIDKNNNLYVIFNEPLGYNVYYINPITNDKKNLATDLRGKPCSMVIDKNNNLYIGTRDGKLWFVSQNPLEKKEEISGGGIINNPIKDILFDKDGRWYAKFENSDKIRTGWKKEDETWVKETIWIPNKDSIIDFTIDKNDDLYILTQSRKFYYKDKNEDKFETLIENVGSEEKITKGTILLDNDNWYLMANGKIYFAKAGEKPKNDTFVVDYGNNKTGLMMFDEDGNLYIVINNEAVYIRGL